MSKALYEEGLSGMESEYAQYAEAKALLDACGISRQALTEEKADIYDQLAQLNKLIRVDMIVVLGTPLIWDSLYFVRFFSPNSLCISTLTLAPLSSIFYLQYIGLPT